MGLSSKFTDVTEVIAKDLRAGQGTSRQSVGGGGTAFGWSTENRMPRTLADYVSVSKCSGMSFSSTIVAPSGTPAAVVAAGGPKPSAVTITTATEALVKHAGLGEANLEATLDASGLSPAIVSVLSAGCLMSFESAAMATLTTDSGGTASGATWIEAITAGQAAVLGAGGSPGLLVVSSQNYGQLLQEIAGGAGFAADPGSPIGAFFGSLIHASPKLAAGTAFVLDPGAVLCVEQDNSPIVIVDAVSQANVNKTRIVADLIATTVVTNAQLVVKATVTGP